MTVWVPGLDNYWSAFGADSTGVGPASRVKNRGNTDGGSLDFRLVDGLCRSVSTERRHTRERLVGNDV